VYKNGDTKREDFENEEEIEDWIFLLRVLGKTSMKAQMFFMVQTNNSVPALVKNQLIFIKKYKIEITTKETTFKHTKCISILIGVNIQYSSIAWYKRDLKHLCKIELGLIEVKYDIIPKNIDYNEYNKSIQEFITPVILTPSALKLNKFGSKYKSYTSVLCNNTPKE